MTMSLLSHIHRLAGYTSRDADNFSGTINKFRFYNAHYEIVSLVGSVLAASLPRCLASSLPSLLAPCLAVSALFTESRLVRIVLFCRFAEMGYTCTCQWLIVRAM